jgi:dephospho-CoA kinase
VQRVGLTGGIASGKSAVAGMLRDMGFQVLDADSVSHHLIEPGQPAYDEVIQAFGADIKDPDGRINRAKLGAIVFADPQKIAKLNSIIHPKVDAVMFRQFDEWQRSGVRDAAFVEAALLVEAGMDKNLDGLVVVWCRPEQQIERMRARGMNETEARRRITAQLPLEEKLRHATYKIDCSGSIEQTRRQVEALAAQLRHPD